MEPETNLPFSEPQSILPKDIRVDFIANDIKAKNPKSNPLLPSQNFALESFSNVFNVGVDTRVKTQATDVYANQAYVPLSSGNLIPRFEEYIPGINNEQRLAQRQSTSEQWTNGVTKFLGKTGTAVLGGTIGTVDGVLNTIKEGSVSAIYTSSFNNWLDDLNTKMDYNLPNYYTDQEKEKSFIQSLGTTNFWANDVLGGLSFTVGTVVSEGIWAYATGGTSLLAKSAISLPSKALLKTSGLNTIKAEGKSLLTKAAKEQFEQYSKSTVNAGKLAKGLNTTRFILTSAGYEAGVEARSHLKETKNNFKRQFEIENGRKPNSQELADFKKALTYSGNSVFATNIALVGSSNLAVLGRLALGKPITGTVENKPLKKLFFGVGYEKGKDGLYKTISQNKSQKILGRLYGIGRPAFIEGFVEEGGQAVTAHSAEDYLLSAYSSDSTKNSLSLIESIYNGFSHTYGTKEGFKEVGIGAIIGILGGGISSLGTGQGLFNEVGVEKAKTNLYVKYRNELSNPFLADILTERLKHSSRIQQAIEKNQVAELSNDYTGQVISDQEVIIATIERDYAFQGIKQGIEDFSTALETYDNKELSEQLGISEEDVTDWKNSKITQYKELANQYEKNIQFANALLGSTNLKEIEGLEDRYKVDLERAIAYNITIGKQADILSETFINEIKNQIAGEFVFEKATDALSVQRILAKADQKKVTEFYKLDTQEKALTEQLEKLQFETSKENFRNEPSKENTQRASELNSLQLKLTETLEELEKVRKQKQMIFQAMSVQSITEDTITEEMLSNQKENAEALKNTLDVLKDNNIEKYNFIMNVFNEYEKASNYALNYSKVTNRLSNPNTRVKELNGWVSKLVKKFEKPYKNTAEFFADITKSYYNDLENSRQQVEKERQVEDKATTPTTEDTINPPAKEQLIEQDPVKNIENKIKQVIQQGAFTSVYFGDDIEQLSKKQPDKKDLEKYNDLLQQIDPSFVDGILLRPYSSESNLTKEQYDEFETLNQKLNDWKTLQGSLYNDNDSVAGLLQLLNEKKRGFEKARIKPFLIEQDFIKIQKAPNENQAASGVSLSTVQNPDNVVTSLSKEKNTIIFSNVNLNTLKNLIPGSTLYKTVEGVDKIDTGENWKTPGSIYKIKTENDSLLITVGERARLEINKDDLNQIISDSNIRIFDFGISNFSTVYKKDSEGNFIPLLSDFMYDSVLENEVINFNVEKAYDLQSGEILRTEINKNDSYNAKLLKDYNKNPNKKQALEDLIKNVHIYVTPQGASTEILGSLRAIQQKESDGQSLVNLYNFRKEAVKKILNSKIDKVDLGRTIPVRFVLTGNPNLQVQEDEDGNLKPVNRPITDSQLNAVEDFGYVENGVIRTQKNIQYEQRETLFARAIDSTNKKVPIIVFRYKNNRQVFPVSLVSGVADKSQQLTEIVNTNLPDSQKIIKIEQLLRENNLDPSSYEIDPTSSFYEQGVFRSWLNSPGLRAAFNDLTRVPVYPDVNKWVNPKYPKSNLKSEILIPINIIEKPFFAGKIVLDLSDIGIVGDTDSLIQERADKESDRISVETELSDIAIELDKDWRTNPAYQNILEGEYQQAFDDNEVFRFPENHVQKLANINILKQALSKKIPKEVTVSTGKEKIDQIKSKLKDLDRLTQSQKKITLKIKSDLNKEVEQQKICN